VPSGPSGETIRFAALRHSTAFSYCRLVSGFCESPLAQ
jgi:hypothetical protein